MEDLISQVTALLRGMWKFRWLGLIVTWVIGAGGMVAAFKVPDRYEAMARLFVDTQSILKPLMSGLAVQPNVDQQVNMLSRTLISRPNIEKLIRMADLDLKNETKNQQETLIEGLMKSVEIKSAGRDNLYSLTYVDPDKDKAKRVIQSMVSIFVESSLGASRKDTDSAKIFLDEQIKTYETKLEAAETRLKDFRLRNIDLQTGEGNDSASRLGSIYQQLQAAKLELREAENARDAARQQVDAEKGISKGASTAVQSLLQEASISIATPEIDARLDALRRNLDQLLQRFTDQHPDVLNSRRMLGELEHQKRREVTELRKSALAMPSNPQQANTTLAMQEMARLQASSEIQVAALKARVEEYSARHAQARALTRTSPQLEAEAAQLNRDYGIVKKSYEDLVARRQSAVMSGDLDMASGVVDFRLIDPPRVSPRPVSPNRLVLLLIALAVGVVAGLSSAFAASQLRPVYNDSQTMRLKSGVPLLGVVSLVLSEEQRRSERFDRLRLQFGAAGFLTFFLVALLTVSILSSRQLD